MIPPPPLPPLHACSLLSSIPPPLFDYKTVVPRPMQTLQALHPHADPVLMQAIEDGEEGQDRVAPEPYHRR